MLFQVAGIPPDSHSIDARATFISLHLPQSLLQVSLSHTSSITRSVLAGLSGSRASAECYSVSSLVSDSEVSPLAESRRPVLSGFSVACLTPSHSLYLPLPSVWAFALGATMPLLTSAARSGGSLHLSPDSETLADLLGKFDRLPRTTAGSTTVPLMDMDFAVNCPLVRHRMPPIRFLFIGSRLCSTLLSDPASRRALALRYHFSSIRL